MNNQTPQNKIKPTNPVWTKNSSEYTSVSYPNTRPNMYSTARGTGVTSTFVEFQPVRSDILMKELLKYVEESPPRDSKNQSSKEDAELDEADGLNTTIVPLDDDDSSEGATSLHVPPTTETKATPNVKQNKIIPYTPILTKFNNIPEHKVASNFKTPCPKHELRGDPKLNKYTPITIKTNGLSNPSSVRKLDYFTPRREGNPVKLTPVCKRYDSTPLKKMDIVLREKDVNVVGNKEDGAKAKPNIQFSMPMPSQALQNKTFEILWICNKEYIVISKLGEGGSCSVYNCVESATLQSRAIKVVNLAVDATTANGYINEVKMLKSMQGSDHVIKMYDFELIKKTLFVVMEKGGIDLSVFLRNMASKSSRLPIYVINYYWMEMLNCVKEIHNSGIIHSDLKPSNFLVVDGRLKLIDFGIASRISGDNTSVIKNVQVGTFNYISPEALLDSRTQDSPSSDKPRIKISYKSDVWSLGCILYQLVYRRTPFHQFGNCMAKIAVIVDRNHRIEYPEAEGVPTMLIDIIKKCLQYDVKLRPTVIELLQMNCGY